MTSCDNTLVRAWEVFRRLDKLDFTELAECNTAIQIIAAALRAYGDARERALQLPTREEIVRVFHVAYESAALLLGWRTQESCRVEFDALPEANKATMLVAADALLRDLTARLGGQEAPR